MASQTDGSTRQAPNFLFLMTDHQRADSLGLVQADVEVTPNLNRLAAESVQFTRAYDACPLCAPARTALATGKYPTRNGIVVNDWAGKSAQDHTPIHQYLAEAGYDVAHIGVDHIRVRPTLRERVEFARWIDNRDHSRHLESVGIRGGLTSDPSHFRSTILDNYGGEYRPTPYSNAKTAVWPHPAEHFKDRYFCSEAIRFLQEPRERPFALFLYLWAPHPPLILPEPYASMFDPDKIELPPNVGIPAQGEPENRRRGVAAQLAERVSMDEWRKAWAAHLGLVRLADDGLGDVLSQLEASGFAENTVVVFTSDHGDHLGQHRMYQKMEMYEQAIRVPLLIRAPRTVARRVEVPVSHLDLTPTLLDFAGIPADDTLDGVSLRDVVASDALPPERPIFSAYSGNGAIGDIRRAVITRRYKYVFDPTDIPELYDLEEDPLETRNLAGEAAYRDILVELHAAGKEWAETHNDWVEFGR